MCQEKVKHKERKGEGHGVRVRHWIGSYPFFTPCAELTLNVDMIRQYSKHDFWEASDVIVSVPADIAGNHR